MIIICEAKATEAQIQAVQQKIREAGLVAHRSDGVEQTILGVVGDRKRLDRGIVSMMPGVRDIVLVSTPYKLASHEFHPEDTVVRVGETRWSEEWRWLSWRVPARLRAKSRLNRPLNW